ncbi:Hypothetical protein NocV09_04400090 [Nannochloropsis oceanica]
MPTSPRLCLRRGSLLLLLFAAVAPSTLAFLLPSLPPSPSTSTRLALSPLSSPSSDTLSTLEAPPLPTLAVDEQGRSRLPWKKEGYSYWTWQGNQIHYVALEGENARQSNKPPIVLIHGFGASVFHWRYNIPALAENHRVYAIDLLGFGLSAKPLTEYNAEVWRNQLAAFLQEIVGVGGSLGGPKAIVVGNSLGGYTALATAAFHPELVQACAVLNGAGSFDPPPEAVAAVEVTRLKLNKTRSGKGYLLDGLKERLGHAARRVVLYSAFFYTKQPGRIKQVLQQVYLNKDNVDDELVESIRYPSLHPNAAEVFCRVVTRTSTQGALTTVNKLLSMLDMPLLLLWGDRDPWISPRMAERMRDLYPAAKRVGLDAGHCPHDEVPEAVNSELLKWIEEMSP